MLVSYRRYFAVLAFLLLATPLVVGVIRPDSPSAIRKEGRRLAEAPDAPASSGDWLALPGRIDAFLRDHFGLRQALIRAHKDLTKPMLGLGNDSVLIGRDGRMFYLGEETVRQSAGLVFRDRRAADATDLIVRMNQALAARGIRFLVASPPNGATIYQDDLPRWAQNPGKTTEYDLIMANLAASGVRTVDLRAPVKQARADGPAFYMHDTHWTPRGALAGFNAIVEADSHPEWRIESSSALGPSTIRKGGDLARMFGVADSVTESVEELTLPSGKKEPLSSEEASDFVETSNKPGPTIMILGDSFTFGYFAPMLLQHVGRVVFLNHHLCRFDWKAIDKFRPDEVWWMPNERFLVCAPGAWPADFAEEKDEGRGRD
jgi:alginate O-acetyltransferase complex protein AlgJ